MELVEGALRGEKYAIARLISRFEDRRVEKAEERGRFIAALKASPKRRAAAIVGITGTPGAGKSTLTAELVSRIREKREDLRIAILAIDPSSHISGGALLGDRTRMRGAAGDERVYFRSQASDTALGGLSPTTFQVIRALFYLFDIVFVETVGIGQSEIDIRFLADRVYLVMQPLAGDEVQFLKAGIMEVPDEIILNKCDEREAAKKSYRALKSVLTMARPFDAETIVIHRVSALTGMNMDALAERIYANAARYRQPDLRGREIHHLERWVEDEWGRVGLRELRALGGASRLLDTAGEFDRAQRLFDDAIREALRR